MGRLNQRLRPITWWKTALSDEFRPTLLLPLRILLGFALIVVFFRIEARHFTAYWPTIGLGGDPDMDAVLILTVVPSLKWAFIFRVSWPVVRSITNAVLDLLRDVITPSGGDPAPAAY
jgi:hypothetical protein